MMMLFNSIFFFHTVFVLFGDIYLVISKENLTLLYNIRKYFMACGFDDTSRNASVEYPVLNRNPMESKLRFTFQMSLRTNFPQLQKIISLSTEQSH